MYVVIGANGYFGSYIVKEILESTSESIIATARDVVKQQSTNRLSWMKCDITDDCSVDRLIKRLKNYERVKVIFLAAYHHPDLVEQNPEYAWDINVSCLSKIVNKLRFIDDLYYASTDSVYGNSNSNYHFKENDELSPVNVYGHQKCAAEAIIQHCGFHVARFPFLIAPSLSEKPHFYDQIVANLNRGNTFEMYKNSYRSSLSFENAAYLLIKLMEQKSIVPSIVNICGDDDLSKYDVGLMIADQVGCDRNLIVPILASDKKQGFQANRAISTLMDNTRLKKILKLRHIDIFGKPE